MADKARKTAKNTRPTDNAPPEVRAETSGAPSPTAVAAEALRTGVVPLAADEPRDVATPDDVAPAAAVARGAGTPHSGEESAMGHMPSPENNDVDAMGRAMGIQEEDSGGLRTSGELLDARDRHRARQDGPDRSGRG
jgi:hypothetical protein